MSYVIALRNLTLFLMIVGYFHNLTLFTLDDCMIVLQVTKREYENTSIKGGGVTGDSLLPVVVFNFSKKKCDEAADFLSSQDFITGAEKAEVINIISDYAPVVIILYHSIIL